MARRAAMMTAKRMLLRVVAGLAGLLAVPAMGAPSYVVVPARSSLSFIGTQQGEKFTGQFRDFEARIAYAADDLATSKLDVTIRVKSLDTASTERDQALATADWFDFARFPLATFRTVAIRATPTGPVGDAELTIKGHTKRIAFPFTWRAAGSGATLDARVAIDRIDFGLGAGEWEDEDTIGHKVEVVVHLTLAAGPPAPPAKPVAKPAQP